jgi:hypothetical protein
MIKKILLASMLMIAPASAETWATGDCTAQTGEKIRYMVNKGNGYISYDGGKAFPMFTEKKGDMAIITHIGSKGNMVLAVDLNTGRGYMITKFDDGGKLEANVSCRLGAMER